MVDSFDPHFHRKWMQDAFQRLQNEHCFVRTLSTKYEEKKEKMIELKYRTELQNGFIKLEYVDCILGDAITPLIIERNMKFDELIKRINYAISSMQAKALENQVPVPTLEQVLEKIAEEKKEQLLEEEKVLESDEKMTDWVHGLRHEAIASGILTKEQQESYDALKQEDKAEESKTGEDK